MADDTILYGTEQQSEYAPTTQVYKATHYETGDQSRRLPFRHRSYISFSYGGKVIEDFGLIAYTEGDRIVRNLYSNFEDLTENYEVVDGQFYWGTHFTNNQLDLNLTTDGITQDQLDSFIEWFSPGKYKELILMEHPNRAVMARVAAVPQMAMLAFEHKVTKKIMGKEYETSISLLKGAITLSFVMDEPFWYAKYSLFNSYLEGAGANGIINLADDPHRIRDLLNSSVSYHKFTEEEINEGQKPYRIDVLAIVYKDENGEEKNTICHYKSFLSKNDAGWQEPGKKEDGKSEKDTPTYFSQDWKIQVTLDNDPDTLINLFYPDNILRIEVPMYPLGDEDYTKICLEDGIPFLGMINDDDIFLGEGLGVDEDSNSESKIYNPSTGRGAHIQYYGYVARNEDDGTGGRIINNQNGICFYYSGNAPSKPILKFIFIPKILSSNGYVNAPANSYSNEDIRTNDGYPYIAIDNKNYFKFTTPSLLTGFNQAIKTVKEHGNNGDSIFELRDLLKENVNEYYSRAWAVKVINDLINTDYVTDKGKIENNFIDAFFTKMLEFIVEGNIDENQTIFYGTPVSCTFNSKTGEAIGIFKVRNVKNGNFITVTENIGDMVRSDYLIIEGQNKPNADGYITKRECHKLTTNYLPSLENVTLIYKNMYY